MKIFISWSGERSKTAAVALRDWLPLILHYAQPWISDRDISAGDRWATEIGKSLEGTNFGILVLTQDNLTEPWLLFEAGALSKAFSSSSVCPVLIDIDFKDISGPLSQFQAKKADKGSIHEIVRAINAKANQAVDLVRLDELFELLWPALEGKFSALPAAATAKAHTRPQAVVLEELVVAVRELDARLRRIHKEPTRPDSPLSSGVVINVVPSLGGMDRLVMPRTLADPLLSLARALKLDVADYGRTWRLHRHGGIRTLTPEEIKVRLPKGHFRELDLERTPDAADAGDSPVGNDEEPK